MITYTKLEPEKVIPTKETPATATHFKVEQFVELPPTAGVELKIEHRILLGEDMIFIDKKRYDEYMAMVKIDLAKQPFVKQGSVQ